MLALPFVSILFAGLVRASPADPPPSTITTAPVLRKRFDSDFVGYVLYDDGDTSILTCISSYTYTYTGGYAGCVDSDDTLGTDCAGDYLYYSTLGMGDSSSVSCSYACITDWIYYSLDDKYPAWKVNCATRSALTVLHMSSSDIDAVSSTGTLTVDAAITTTGPPSNKETITVTATPTSSTGLSVPLTPTPEPKKNNGAVIGGAVAGSLVFLGLVIAGAFFFFAKRRKTHVPANQTGGQSVQGQQPPMMNQDQSVAMSPSPMSPAPFSPQPYNPHAGAFAPPPAYGQEKGATASAAPVESKPVQYEHRVPEVGVGIHEAYGNSVNPPMSPVPAPAAYSNELPGQSSQPQRMQPQGMQPQMMPPQGRSELG